MSNKPTDHGAVMSEIMAIVEDQRDKSAMTTRALQDFVFRMEEAGEAMIQQVQTLATGLAELTESFGALQARVASLEERQDTAF